MAIRITGLNSGLDTESIISALVSSYSVKKDKYVKAQTKLSWKQETWQDLNTKIYSLYNQVGQMRYNSGYSLYTASVSDSTKASVSVTGDAVRGVQSLEVTDVAQSGYLTGAEMSTIDNSEITAKSTLRQLGFTSGRGRISVSAMKEVEEDGKTVKKRVTTEIEVNSSMTIQEFADKLTSAGVKANFDEKNKRLFVSAKDTGKDNDFELKSLNDDGDSALYALGLSMSSTTYHATNYNTGNHKVAGSDAAIVLNGVTYTSATNEFEVNGLSITAKAKTAPGESITVTTATDTQGIYDKVKEFLSSYNSLINEITALYNADSSKGYEPLTDEEKDAMSDTEIEKWENKIKSSLLRRDSTLQGVMSAMTTAMSRSYKVGEKSYNLTNFGIATLGFLNAAKNEQYAYHIDGDEDDTSVANKEYKLMAAIKEDPEGVVNFMKELSTGLYNAIDAKMKTTELSSVYKVYNDKEMASEYSDYTKTISKWEEKLTDMEDYYYKKFAAMETALAKLNSQQSSISGLFGSM